MLAALLSASPADAKVAEQLVWSGEIKLKGRPNEAAWTRGRLESAFYATEHKCLSSLDRTPPKHVQRLHLDVVLVADATGRLRRAPATVDIMPSVSRCLIEEVTSAIEGLPVERVAVRLRPGTKKPRVSIDVDLEEVPLEAPALPPGTDERPPREVLAAALVAPLPRLVELSFPCTHAYLRTKEPAALRVLRNEVFARHGRAFQSRDLQAHFGQKAWYRIRADYDDALLSDDDRECVRRISVFEHVWRTVYRGDVDLDKDGKKEPMTFLIRSMAPPPPVPGAYTRNGWPATDYTLAGLLLVGDASLEVPIRYGNQTPQHDTWTPLALVDTYGVRAGVSAIKGSTTPVAWVRLGGDRYMGPRQSITLVRAVPLGLEVYRDFFWADIQGELVVFDFDNACTDGHDLHYAYSADGLVLDHTTFEEKAHSFCAACPFVEVESAGGWEPRGEILRHLVGEAAERWQSLPLGTVVPVEDEIRVRLLEKKQERTFLRDLRLRGAGDALPLVRCALNGAAVPCPAGGDRLVLSPGDELLAVFSSPKNSGARQAEGLTLEARGFYVPLPVGEGSRASPP